MNFYEKLAAGLCPNDCGEMFEPNQPIYVWTLVPLDVLEAYHESASKPEEGDIDFDRVAIVAICPKCGFVLTMNVDPEHNPGGHGMVHIERRDGEVPYYEGPEPEDDEPEEDAEVEEVNIEDQYADWANYCDDSEQTY